MRILGPGGRAVRSPWDCRGRPAVTAGTNAGVRLQDVAQLGAWQRLARAVTCNMRLRPSSLRTKPPSADSRRVVRAASRIRGSRRPAWARLSRTPGLPSLGVIAAVAVAMAACGASSGVSLSGGASSRAAGQTRTVLVLTQTLGYHHASIPAAITALRRVAAQDGRYRVVFLPSAARLTPTALKHAAAVVFLLTTGELPLNSSDKEALVRFVRSGGGLVGFHSATDTFHHWQAYTAMMGAEFSYHRAPSTQPVVVEDRDTPATRTLPRGFTIHEEFYGFNHGPRPRVHVLVRLNTGPRGPDRPLVWCRRFGGGRVFYDALGHFAQTWSDPRQLALVSGGIAWATNLIRAPSC